MQTFLPYSDFNSSAECLDMRRLGKQRVEVIQILNALLGKSESWKNHPATKMWKGYELALAFYGIAICDEWILRGYNDTCKTKINLLIKNELSIVPEFNKKEVIYPFWLGDETLHSSHRSNLLRKMPEHYSQFGWTDPPDLPHVWPV